MNTYAHLCGAVLFFMCTVTIQTFLIIQLIIGNFLHVKRRTIASIFFISTITIAGCLFFLSFHDALPQKSGMAIETLKHLSDARFTASAEEARSNAPLDTLPPLTLDTPEPRHWWHDVVIYQIWPRSYLDTDGDGIGDLPGITQRLGYLKDLGVTAIWLNPIFKSSSIHGYDTVDFYEIEKDLGTMADFDTLLAEAKKLGIKIILDLAINHVSNEHPWFIQSANKVTDFDDFFIWSKTLPEGYGKAWSTHAESKDTWHYVTDYSQWKTDKTRKDWYYGTFDPSQPDLNLKNPAVVDEVKRLTKFWIDKGVDGFRLDAIRYLIEEGGLPLQADTESTLKFWIDFSAYVKSINPEIFLIGESFADTEISARYFSEGKGLDMVFDFNFGVTIGDALAAANTLPANQDQPEQYYQGIRESLWNNLRYKRDTGVPIHFFAKALNNHDLDRIHQHFIQAPLAANVAAAMLMTLPGTPVVYYGDEINMHQFTTGNDESRRAPMQWSAQESAGFTPTKDTWMDRLDYLDKKWKDGWQQLTNKTLFTVEGQQKETNSTLNTVKRLIAMRAQDSVIKHPTKITQYNHTGSALVLKYEAEKEVRWVMMNLSSSAKTTFTVPSDIPFTQFDVLNKKIVRLSPTATLSPGQVMVLRTLATPQDKE